MAVCQREENAEKRRHGGAGLKDALAYELELRNIPVKRQLPVSVLYKDVPVVSLSARLGLVLNFGQPLLRDGISRVVNNLSSPPRPRVSRAPR